MRRFFAVFAWYLVLCGGSAWGEPTKNQPPVLLFQPLSQPETLVEGKVYRQLIEAYDPDGVDESLKFQLLNAPGGQQIRIVPIGKRGCCTWRAMLLWWPKRAPHNFSYQFDIEVSDRAGSKDKKTCHYNVFAAPLAPTIVSTPITQATEGLAYTYTLQATDPDASQMPALLFYRLIEAPKGMTVGADGVIHWTPTASDVGTQQVVVEVRDEFGQFVVQPYQIQVKDTPSPPKIMSTPSPFAAVGRPYIYRLWVTDEDRGASHTFSIKAGPKDLKLDPTTGHLRWTPSASGNVTITLVVKDDTGLEKTQTWSVQVVAKAPLNASPSLSLKVPASHKQGTSLSLPVQALDADGDDLAFVLLGAPEGMVLQKTGKQVATLTWTPSALQTGAQSFTIGLDDKRGGVLSRTFSIYIEDVNDPPQWHSQPPVRTSQHQTFFYQPHVYEPEGERLTFSLNVAPAGMSIDPLTGSIRWRPTRQADVGDHQVHIVARDTRGGQSVQSFVLHVQDRNDTPAITSLPPTTASEGVMFRYQVKAEDPDGANAKLFYRLVQGPHSMKIAYTGEVTWLPTNDDVGGHSVMIEVVDEYGAREQQSFSLQVQNVNSKPVVTSIPLKGAILGKKYYYQVVAKDPDIGDQLSFALEGGPQTMTISQKGLISWTPQPSEIQASSWFEVKVRVFDALGGETLHTYKLQVYKANEPPTLEEAPPVKATEEQSLSYQLKATDPDGDVLQYAMERGPDGLSVSESGLLSWTPHNSDVGRHDVTIRVDDQKGGLLIHHWTIEVVNVNQPPQFHSEPRVLLTENTPYSYQLRAIDPDPTKDGVQYSLLIGPKGMTLDATSGMLRWTPKRLDATTNEGVHEVLLKVVDVPHGESQLQHFFVYVSKKNTPPTLAQLPATQVTEGTPYRSRLSINDVDNDDVHRYLLLEGPKGLTIGTLSGLLSWLPGKQDVGTHDVRILVYDQAGATLVQDFQLQVNDINQSPQFLSAPPTGATVGKTLTYAFLLGDIDDAPKTLSVSLLEAPSAQLPAHQPLLDSTRATLQWTPGSEHAGKYVLFTLEVKDKRGGRQLQSFVVYVHATNQLPTWKSVPSGVLTLQQGATLQQLIAAIDPDKDVLTYFLRKGPKGMVLTTDGVLWWRPSAAQSGLFSVEVEVCDGKGGTLSATFQVNVTTPNQAPTITSRPSLFVKQGQSYTYQVVASDPEQEPLSFRLEQPLTGMAMDAQSGLFTWSPLPLQRGEHLVRIRVSDRGGLFAVQTFILTVTEDNGPPSFESQPVTFAEERSEYRYLLKASDPNGDMLHFRFVSGPAGMQLVSLDRERALLLWTPRQEDLSTTGHRVELLVDDGRGASVTQTFLLKVRGRNDAPRFVSTPCLQAQVGIEFSCVSLRAEDVDTGDVLGFRLIESPAGMTLNATNTANKAGKSVGFASLQWLPKTEDVGRQLVILEVFDGQGASERLSFFVTVQQNQGEPIAVAGKDLQTAPGEVILDGSSSSDPKGGTVSCQWSLERAPDDAETVKIQEPSLCKTKTLLRKAGVYVFRLAVSSGERKGVPAFLRVNVNNVPPCVNAWAPRASKVGQKIALDARGSSDANGDVLSFKWTQLNTESQLKVELQEAESERAYFTPAVVGVYHFRLLVRDKAGGSQSRELSIAIHDPSSSYVPHAVIVAPQAAKVKEAIVLDGSRSRQLDGLPVNYKWTILPERTGDTRPKEGASLSGDAQPKVTFRAESPGYYRIGLRVTSGELSSLQTVVGISISEDGEEHFLPLANASPLHGNFGQVVTLDASKSIDFGGGQLSFSWQQLEGRDVTLLDAKTARPSFFSLHSCDLTFRLEVESAGGKSAPLDVLVRGNVDGNQPPIAKIDTSSQTSWNVGQAVELKGHTSYDPEGEALRYRWRQVDGFPVVLFHPLDTDSSASFIPPTYGIYTFSLEVHDGKAWSMPARISIVADQDGVNHVPRAHAGEDLQVRVGQSVTLDGSKSVDLDEGDNLTYTWRVIEPPNAVLNFNLANPQKPSFSTRDKLIQKYVIGLQVDDGKSRSIEDTVTIRVLGINRTPIARIAPLGDISVGDMVVLDGGLSEDPDGDTLSYEWKQLAGPTDVIDQSEAQKVTFQAKQPGQYRFQLRVFDGYAYSAPVEVIVGVEGEPEEKGKGCGCQATGGGVETGWFWVLCWLFFVFWTRRKSFRGVDQRSSS